MYLHVNITQTGSIPVLLRKVHQVSLTQYDRRTETVLSVCEIGTRLTSAYEIQDQFYDVKKTPAEK
jgi:hypothetical protein